MGQVINTNTLSLLTQNNLSKSQSALNTSIQRLSSGLRINSAKDDAAGQAIANRFSASIRGLTQAQHNANDGISLAQTTEGALNEVNNNLQRIRELTVQAANGSNSAADKVSIQAEITQRLAEINRTSTATDFNGTKVLSANQSLTVQVGANDGETINIQLKKMDSAALGLTGFNVSGLSDTLTSYSSTNATTGVTTTVAFANSAVNTAGLTSTTNTAASAMTVHGLGAATNGVYAAYAVQDTDGKLYRAGVNTTTGVVTANLSDTTTLATAAAGYVTDALANKSATSSPLTIVDAALATVDALRGDLGAVQNRFDSVISNLGTTVNNLQSSMSRIQDADYATEVSNMTRAQILQQAGTSVLAKANQSTQGVMALLQ